MVNGFLFYPLPSFFTQHSLMINNIFWGQIIFKVWDNSLWHVGQKKPLSLYEMNMKVWRTKNRKKSNIYNINLAKWILLVKYFPEKSAGGFRSDLICLVVVL